jgi:CHAT domain-containing protein
VPPGTLFRAARFPSLASLCVLVASVAGTASSIGCSSAPPVPQPSTQAIDVVVSAEKLRRSGQPAEALASLQTQRVSCHAAGDARCEAFVLVGLGEYHAATGTPDMAKTECGQAQGTLRKVGETQGNAMALSCLAAAALASSSFEQGEKDAAEAETLATSAKDLRVAGWAAARRGEALWRLGKNEEAARALSQAADEKLGDSAAAAEIFREAGVVKYKLGDFRAALVALQPVLDAFRKLSDRAGEGSTLSDMAAAQTGLGENQKALDLLEQALLAQRVVGNRLGEATALDAMADAYFNLGELQKVLGVSTAALPIQRAVGDRSGEGTTLMNIAGVYSALGEKQKTLDFLNQALPIYRAVGDRPLEAIALNNLGETYSSLGESQKALGFFTESLPVLRAIGDRFSEARTLNNIAAVYQNLGENQKALDFYEQGLGIHRAIGDRDGEAVTLNNIATVYDNLGESQRALDLYSQALPIRRALKDRRGEATTLGNIGRVYFALGDYQKALDFYNQALPIHRAARNRGKEAVTLTNIGRAYAALGDKARALDFYTQALPIHRAVGARPYEASTLYNISVVLSSSNPARAIFHAKQAVNLYQSLRRDIRGLPPEVRRTYAGTVAASYRGLADLLAEQGRLSEAQRVLELLKDEEFFEYVRRDEKAVGSKDLELRDDEKAASIRYDALAGTITRVGAEYGELQRKASRTPDEEARLASLGKQLEQANATFLSFLRGLSTEFARGAERARGVYEASSSLRKVLGTLDPGTVAVFTLVSEKKLRTILVTAKVRKGYTHATALSAAELGKRVLALREALQDKRVDPRPLAKELYDVLVKPMARDLAGARASTILWYLDGPLRYVPMGALYDGSTWLVEKYRSVVLSGGSLAKLEAEPHAVWTALAMGVTKALDGFPALPGVSNEVEALVGDGKAVRGVLSGVGLLDAQFTDAALMDVAHRNPSVVHVASHFVFRPGDEGSSFLLLGDGTHLTLRELRKRPPIFEQVDLLTLSACNTAVEGGEGTEVDGLARIAEEKGAAAVLATLWPVSDFSTPALILRFYALREEQEPSGKQRTKAEALQDAQKEMALGKMTRANSELGTRLENSQPPQPGGTDRALPGWTHPYYWASFVLLGNGR